MREREVTREAFGPCPDPESDGAGRLIYVAIASGDACDCDHEGGRCPHCGRPGDRDHRNRCHQAAIPVTGSLPEPEQGRLNYG